MEVTVSNHTASAICAKEEFEALMFHLGVKPEELPPDSYDAHELSERASYELERLAPALTSLCNDFGYRYEEPTLYEGSMRLIVESPVRFYKHYAGLLRNMDRDPFSVSFIL